MRVTLLALAILGACGARFDQQLQRRRRAGEPAAPSANEHAVRTAVTSGHRPMWRRPTRAALPAPPQCAAPQPDARWLPRRWHGDTGPDIAGNHLDVFAIAAGTLDYSE